MRLSFKKFLRFLCSQEAVACPIAPESVPWDEGCSPTLEPPLLVFSEQEEPLSLERPREDASLTKAVALKALTSLSLF